MAAAVVLAIHFLDLIPLIVAAVLLAVIAVAILGGLVMLLIAIPTYLVKKGGPEPGRYELDEAMPYEEEERR